MPSRTLCSLLLLFTSTLGQAQDRPVTGKPLFDREVSAVGYADSEHDPLPRGLSLSGIERPLPGQVEEDALRRRLEAMYEGEAQHVGMESRAPETGPSPSAASEAPPSTPSSTGGSNAWLGALFATLGFVALAFAWRRYS